MSISIANATGTTAQAGVATGASAAPAGQSVAKTTATTQTTTVGSSISDVVRISSTAQQFLTATDAQGLVFDAQGATDNGKRIDIIANKDGVFSD